MALNHRRGAYRAGPPTHAGEARWAGYGEPMGKVSASIEVPLGIEATWDAAVDWPGQQWWVPGSTVRSTGGTGYRSTIEARTGWAR